MREIQPQFNPGGIEKQFGRSRTQLARVNKEISTSQPLSRPESTNQATMLDHLPNGTTEVHQTSQATSKHHFGRQIQKIGREKCLLREIDEGSSIRPTAMHRMADELKTSRRREHRWKLILWSPKNTKEEERKETIEQIRDGQRNHIPKPLARTTKDLRIHTFKSPQTSQGATKHKVGR
ncbi:unnamed protein product [Microthlaspi erraticum]|uniref:Uncharacterized protein n=1 Tax=Microthlaspi erraticum TaxID=1685480 RepID=A0A6D2HMX0_9BRAS|nr:unnamed protein product [Microthlaspi erraticum]